ncbi:MAG: hypothetical protein ACR2MX_05075 [Cyclobacteriaceae bacterium]
MSTTYGLGGTEVKQDANEAIQEIPQNKTLMVEKLTSQAPLKPAMVNGLKKPQEVFEHFKPKVDLSFEDSEGMTRQETLHFKSLADFGPKGITRGSQFLQGLATENDQYKKIIKQLKTNKVLKSALADPAAKAALISAIENLQEELKQAK